MWIALFTIATATAVSKLIARDRPVALLGEVASSLSLVAAPLAQNAKIPMISPSSTNPKYTQQGFKTTFRVVANDDQQGPVAAQFALATLRPRKVAVIDDSTAYGQGLAEAFETAVRRTRSFARRQRMWFRRDPRITWFAAPSEISDVAPALLAWWGAT